MMKSFSQRIPFLYFGPMMLVVSFGLLITLLLALFVRNLEQQTLKAYFVQLAEDDIFAIRTTLDWYLEPLEAVAAFYNASVAINREEYATFVKPFLEQRPSIETIQWIPRIPDDQRVVYETTARHETAAGYDFSHFTFTEYRQTADDKQRLVPVSIRAEYYPIYYQEPLRRQGAPLGFDFASNPSYVQALTSARDLARRVAIEDITLTTTRDQPSFTIQVFYPIYAASGLASTPQTRVRYLIGFVAIVLRVQDLLDRLLQDMPPDNINLSIYENFASPTAKVLYHNQRLSPSIASAGSDYLSGLWNFYSLRPETLRVVKPLTTLGQQWQVVLQPTTTYMARNALWYHWFVWACGLFGTGGVTAYLYLVLNRNLAAERMVRDRTAQLHQANTQLQAAMQELQERQQHEKAVVEEELARVRNQLVANTRLATLGQIAATIAHELRNPLGAVRNAVFYIRRYLAKDQQELLEFLQIIDVEVTTSDRIITDLLEMSWAKTPSIQQLDLCAIAQEIWGRMTCQGTIHFQCVVTREPFWLWADATQFRQILTNLLTNAVQAMAHGGDLSIHAAYQGNTVVVTIQDSGPGVPPALRDQIFEPLFTTKAKGTGLGLTLCRQIMARHGGTIQLVDSGQGARFELRLPNRSTIDGA